MRFRILVGLLLFGILLMGGVSGTDWPMFHRDLNHTGYSPDDAPGTEILNWTFNISETVHTSPIVAQDRVFFGVGRSEERVYALNASTGVQLWNFSIDAGGINYRSSQAVSSDSVFVVDDVHIFCLNASTGTQIWNRTLITGGGHSALQTHPTVSGGVVFVGGVTNYTDLLYAINVSDGGVIWTHSLLPATSYGTGSPIIQDDYVIYGTGNTGTKCYVFKLNKTDGAQVWNWTFIAGMGNVAALSADEDNVFFGIEGATTFYTLNVSTGIQLWNFSITMACRTPAVADGRVYINNASVLYGLNTSTGAQLWNHTIYTDDAASALTASPSLADANGDGIADVFIIGADTSFLPLATIYFQVLNGVNGSLIWNSSSVFYSGSTPAISNGAVFVGAVSGLYAFGGYSPTPSDLTPPNITLNWPLNHTKTKDRTPGFNFTATDDTAATLSCSLYLNGVLNTTNSFVINGTATIITPTGNLSNGWINWSLYCEDGFGNSYQTGTYWVEVRYWPFTAIATVVSVVGYLLYRRFRRGRR